MLKINRTIAFTFILFTSILYSCDRPIHKLKQVVKTVSARQIPKNEKKKQAWVFNQYKDYVFGIDFSHHQALVSWDKIKSFNNKKVISFAIVRATMGTKRKDNYFTHNWRFAKKYKIIRGAYHYYRPDENSTQQANNYIKNVKLQIGDLPPILDIEKTSKRQSIANLKIGLKNWLNIIEKHYGVKPIIYSGDKFYSTYLKTRDFKDYTIWIANYNNIRQPKVKGWSFWQFSEQGKVKGINGYVDLNVFKGNKKELTKLRLLK